jgi:HK97 family phage portal protein/HK97 family phage prohead protease
VGVLATRVAAALEEARNDTGWLTRDDGDEMVPPSSAGVRVTQRSALGLSTFWRCVDLISHAVSITPRDVLLSAGGQSYPQYSPPAWLDTPNPNDPNYMADDYFGEQAISMLIEGNAFVDVFPHVWEPQVLTVVAPTRVRVIPGPRYEILDEAGKVQRTLSPMNMLHGWWMKMPGESRGISPLEHFRRTLGGSIAADDFAARFFGQGAALAFGVEVPYALDDAKRETLRSSLKAKYAGLRNSHAIGVLSEGAKFVPGLAPSPEQAQMLATRKFSVEDIARIYGVPPGMAGSQEPGASSYASDVSHRKNFRDDAVLKFTTKLERLHGRLLNPPTGNPNVGTFQLKFNLDWIARTDLLARYQAHSEGVRGGFLTPNEVRAIEDLPPMPLGELLYMQQQMVPLADLGKTKATEPLDTQPAPAGVAAMTTTEFEDRSTALWPEDDLEVRSIGDGLTFEGYALKWNSWSRPIPGGPRGAFREQFMPDAFARTLSREPDIALRVEHQMLSLPLGRTSAGTFSVRADSVGLLTAGDLPDNELGRPVRDAIRRKELRGMSIRFRVPNEKTGARWSANYAERTVVEAALGPEISIVTFPAYPDTTAAVRALAEAADLPVTELEQAVQKALDPNPDTRLTNIERDLVMSAINAKTDEPLVGPRLARARERLAARA